MKKNNLQTKKTINISLIVILSATAIVIFFEFPKYFEQINLIVLTATLAVLVWYAWETKEMREQTVLQTELTTMPIMSLYIRNVNGVKDEGRRQSIKEKYAITHQVDNGIISSPFFFALRNMGNGPAFNVEIENNNFIIEKYQTRFFAPEPKGDEHAIKIIKKPNNKIRNLDELKDEIFIIRCKSVLGKDYEYKYKINDVAEHIIEFIK